MFSSHLPRTPSSHLPKTFDLIESLFMVGGKIDIGPCENGFEKNSRSNDASGVFFLSKSKKMNGPF